MSDWLPPPPKSSPYHSYRTILAKEIMLNMVRGTCNDTVRTYGDLAGIPRTAFLLADDFIEQIKNSL